MEVSKAEPTIHEYWQKYRRRSLFFLICMQIIAVFIVASAMMVFHIVDGTEPVFWIVLFAVLTSVLGINVMVFLIISEPLKQLTAALAQKFDETSPLLPPNPNADRYERTGLKPLLMAIYDLNDKTPITAAATDSKNKPAGDMSAVDEALDDTSAGIVMFDGQGKLVFSNSSAPLIQNPDGSSSLDLLFYTDTTFDAWLAECKSKSVRADKTWTHIASKPTGEDDRKVYDVVASYRKDSAVSVIVVLLEKTAEYTPEDDDLNFIAFAAHELRGPITVIRGYLDTLNDELATTMDEEQRELFDRLIVSANRLSSYINNILNSSRYDRRHLSVHLVKSSIHDIYDVISDDMRLRASAQRRILSVDLPADLPTVAADLASIGEVLGNLIDNAIKYSNEGGSVEVSAEQKGDSLEIFVRDHGIGMPANVVGNLFHKFYRSHRSRETVAGTGIGLYISKAIVESHGGTMEAKSVEGEGSTFSFTLPLYDSVADKLAETGGDNSSLIVHHAGSWIKNHGSIRG